VVFRNSVIVPSLAPFPWYDAVSKQFNLQSNNSIQSIKSDHFWHLNVMYPEFRWLIIMGSGLYDWIRHFH
jgi:hypothetical protein